MNFTGDHPSVSVVIPLYNAGKYIEEAIQSVLAQTISGWDVWIVDDGSTDEGPDKAKKLAAVHPTRIHYLEHPNHENRGVSASRNLAIADSRGEFVAFLDADDLWEPDKLEAQAEILKSNPEVGLVYSSGIPIQADGRPWMPESNMEPIMRIVYEDGGMPRVGYGPPDQAADLFDEFARHCCLVTSSVMARRSLLERGGLFDSSMRDAEDWLLYTCVAFYSKCYFIARPLFRYRIHAQNASIFNRGTELAQFRGSAVFLRKLAERLDEKDSRVKRALAENRRAVYGRALTRSEQAFRERRWKEMVEFVKFALSSFPEQVLGRRTARFAFRLVTGSPSA